MSIFNASNRELGRWERFLNALRDQRQNEVGIERANAQQSLSELRRMQAQRLAAQKGREALTGISDPTEKVAANRATAEQIGRVNANTEAQAYRSDDAFRDMAWGISKRKMKAADDKVEQISKAGAELSALAGGITGSLVNGYRKRRKAVSNTTNV